jgi:hypothetical protein
LARPSGAHSPINTIYPTFTTIDVPGKAVTEIYGINRAGDMVGIYGATTSDPHQREFLLKGGRFIHVDYPKPTPLLLSASMTPAPWSDRPDYSMVQCT